MMMMMMTMTHAKYLVRSHALEMTYLLYS